MKLYPIMINLSERDVIVIGGGNVALRKISDILETGARIKVIAPDIIDEIRVIKENNRDRIELINRKYQPGDLEKAALVFSASDDRAANKRATEESKSRNIFINSSDDPLNSTFHVPSFARKGDLILSLSTGGASPAMAARLRRELEKYIPADIDEILDGLTAIREILMTHIDYSGLTPVERGRLLKKLTDDDQLLRRIASSRNDKKALIDIIKIAMDGRP